MVQPSLNSHRKHKSHPLQLCLIMPKLSHEKKKCGELPPEMFLVLTLTTSVSSECQHSTTMFWFISIMNVKTGVYGD